MSAAVDDIRQAWSDGERIRTHYVGCHVAHAECAVHVLLAEVDQRPTWEQVIDEAEAAEQYLHARGEATMANGAGFVAERLRGEARR